MLTRRNIVVSIVFLLGVLTIVLAIVANAGSKSEDVSVLSSGSAQDEYLIIDSDVGLDDFLAMSLILQNLPHLKYKLLGITTVQGIQAINESSTNVARYITGSGLHTSTFVGASTPIDGHLFPSSFDDRDRSDLIFNFPICDSNCTNLIKDISALDFLLSSAQKFPGKVTILAIGPLTNIANAIQRDPQFATHIKEIFIMGGSLEVPGNVMGFNSSEWNFYADPLAAKVVIESGISVCLVPLDVINYITCDNTLVEMLNKTSNLSFGGNVLKRGIFWICDNWLYKLFYDMIAAAVVIDKSLFELKEFQVQVNSQDGSITPGSGFPIIAAVKVVNVSTMHTFVVNSVIN